MNDLRSFFVATPRRLLLAVATIAVTVFLPAIGSAQGERLQYNEDIRPILNEHCFSCHGPDSASRQADLRLDQREPAIEMKAIVPAKPDESEIIRRILSGDPDELMPPPKSKKPLSDAQKELLKRWVAEGAEYQPHWSFIPPTRPKVPAVQDQAWVRNPIDAFILSRLEKMSLKPAPEADRRTLLRRVAFDLTGLPPKPEDVEAAANDKAPNWYEKFVDLQMSSPAWGEHRGRYWLDAARYADTHGIHFDNFREMWSYREWVIRAFNENIPFDQFTIEQLAGDLLPNATLDQQIASGFHRCNMTKNEGGIIDEEYIVLYARDRTETTATVWMGLTAGCCTCHDHKFDPLTQKEFYELSAFFNNTTQGARDGNVQNTPPIVNVPRGEDRDRLTQLPGLIAAAKERLESRKKEATTDFATWLAAATVETVGTGLPQQGVVFEAPLNDGEGKTTKFKVNGEERSSAVAENATWVDGPLGSKALQFTGQVLELSDVGDFGGEQAFSCSAWVKLNANDSSGAICSRMNKDAAYRGWDFWTQGRRVGTHIIHSWSDNALKVVAAEQVPANEWTHVAFTYDGSRKASGVKVYYNGKEQKTNVESDKLGPKADTHIDVPFKIGQRHNSDPLSNGQLQDLRIYNRNLQPGEVSALANGSQLASVIAKKPEERTDKEKEELFQWWLTNKDESTIAQQKDLAALEKENADLKARGTIAHVMAEKNAPAMAFILSRGDYDKRLEQVSPGTPAVLPKYADELPKNRLGLAKWLLTPEHPLTARTTVNRYWQELFGTGIVRSTNDLGTSGELPINQELLDWLAVEFRESGWNIKQFFKLLVMSNAYRQSAVTTPEKLAKDLENRHLSRGPRFRMDAEMVRDTALTASGLLVRKIGGPSVKPYQPDGVWDAVAMPGSNTRFYKQDSGEGLYRRSLYTFWKRAAPPASMEILNAPNREVCTVRRDRTNTPLQALLTLNDPQFVEAARNLAQSALLHGGDKFETRLEYITLRLIARPFRSEEAAIAQHSLAELAAFYNANAEAAKALLAVGESKPDEKIPPAELASWTMLVNQLMNLDEVLNK